jgi:drug/metabolite transporter (DMT)-like permease
VRKRFLSRSEELNVKIMSGIRNLESGITPVKKGALGADFLLILTAMIWGSAFVAQRMGMDFVGPFLFNGIRFALGSLFLVPFVAARWGDWGYGTGEKPLKPSGRALGTLLAGFILFGGASLQQVGIVYTTAGKAGFITGLYVILVPILGLRWGQRASFGTWTGAALAVTGLYLLSVTERFTIAKGDFLVLIGAFMWAAHVLWIGWLSPRMNPIILASSQFAVCSFLSLGIAVVFEPVIWQAIVRATVPILYSGILSVGVAYTLQVVAQRSAHPAHAAIILSMEGVFAVISGWIILRESLSVRGLAGCSLMLTGMVLSQLWIYFGHELNTHGSKTN